VKTEEGSAGRLTWQRIDWLETAVCSIPCNPGASITLAKSLSLPMEQPTTKSKDELEEDRFLADIERVRTGAISVRNIAAHWSKAGRDLSPEYIEHLLAAHTELSALVETYLPASEPEGTDTAPCVLTLPQKPHLTLG